MAPILEELRTDYAGRMQIDFIDVWKNPGAGDPYNVYMIPTQIFFDGDGRELTRHRGFLSKADIRDVEAARLRLHHRAGACDARELRPSWIPSLRR